MRMVSSQNDLSVTRLIKNCSSTVVKVIYLCDDASTVNLGPVNTCSPNCLRVLLVPTKLLSLFVSLFTFSRAAL
eukprot:scaffold3053_cov204-Alexandrium_tamarense.AAC.8